jgi:hypothetical protein
MWLIMAVSTESAKKNKVQDVWACCVLHNMYMRYRKREYLAQDPAFAAEQVYFAALAREVLAEVDIAHAPQDEQARAFLRSVGVDVDRAMPVRTAAPTLLQLRTAGVDLRDEVCRVMWASAQMLPL